MPAAVQVKRDVAPAQQDILEVRQMSLNETFASTALFLNECRLAFTADVAGRSWHGYPLACYRKLYINGPSPFESYLSSWELTSLHAEKSECGTPVGLESGCGLRTSSNDPQ